MIYHATTLHILFVNVVYKLDKEWCPPSLNMTTFMGSIQECAIERHSRATRNFLSKSEEKERSLATGCYIKGSNRCVKNI
jgi:hypothetical protein